MQTESEFWKARMHINTLITLHSFQLNQQGTTNIQPYVYKHDLSNYLQILKVQCIICYSCFCQCVSVCVQNNHKKKITSASLMWIRTLVHCKQQHPISNFYSSDSAKILQCRIWHYMQLKYRPKYQFLAYIRYYLREH